MISDIVLAMKWKERGASDSSNLFNEFSVCVCEKNINEHDAKCR